MSATAELTFSHDTLTSRVVFGAGRARTDLRAEIDALGGRRVVMIASDRDRALTRELSGVLDKRLVGSFTGVRPHVPVEVAEAARGLAEELQADLLLSIGGGSTTGTAKVVALTSGLPIVAIPTTYAGSEVTPVWGMTEAGRKTTGRDRKVLPRVVIYDPELTLSLPRALSVASGCNALAHAVEAFWAPGATPLSSALAERGIRALAEGLPAVAAAGDDVTARGNVLLGAWLAGASFAVSGSGLHHKICHVLGGAYDLPHAELHTVVLPHVLAFNAPACPAAATGIAAALATKDAVSGVVALLTRLQAPVALRDLGLREDQLEEATDLVLDGAPRDNPRPLDRGDVARLLHAAWVGTSPDASEGPR